MDEDAISNLIQNAAKFTDSGFIRVETEDQADGILFKVEDSGPRIPAEHQKTLFTTVQPAIRPLLNEKQDTPDLLRRALHDADWSVRGAATQIIAQTAKSELRESLVPPFENKNQGTFAGCRALTFLSRSSKNPSESNVASSTRLSVHARREQRDGLARVAFPISGRPQ